MRRIAFGLLLCLGMLSAGCDRPESDSVSETTAKTAATETSEQNAPAADPLPPAPVPDKPLFAKSFINRPAPEFVVAEWLNREPDREGKMVLIDFWATWCKPCIESIPKLNQFHRNHKDRLAVIGVSDETADEVRNHPGAKINYALAIDPQRRMYNEFGITHIPNLLLIDPTGIVRWQGNPSSIKGHELTEDVLVELLDTYVK
jgi:cytochrome c biogenesis protein CcmG, thiol:disulfide interchange protein DsbE